MTIKDNIVTIISTIPQEVKLVAVSKFHPSSALKEAYDAGQRVFGESRPQEMAAKHRDLPYEDMEWHFIGHLQTNKISMIAPFVSLIESVDSLRLMEAISKEAIKIGRTIPILLQVHIATEDTKQGFSTAELEDLLSRPIPNGIKIEGLMGMATLTDDRVQISEEFRTLRTLFDRYASKHGLTTLSMGMSSDYMIAIEQGSTTIRIGSAIFGNRNY